MLRIRSVFTGVAGTPYYSNLYFDGSTLADAQSAHDRVFTFWDALEDSLKSPMQVQVESEVPVIAPADGTILSVLNVVPTTPTLFTSVAEALPPANQMMFGLNTGVYLAGRQLRGRLNIPGWTISANTVGGGVDQAVAAQVGILLNALNGSEPSLQVWSKKNGVARDVTGFNIPVEWAILRSRRD